MARGSNAKLEVANRIAEAAEKVREEANFVVIGYELQFDAYKTLASLDEEGTICPESDSVVNGKKYCYYNSDSDNVASLFLQFWNHFGYDKKYIKRR